MGCIVLGWATASLVLGTVTSSSGTATPVLQFQGQYRDAESGLIYLRARYYDPATAQFLSRDPLVRDTRQAYAYANNDPYDLIDPFGLSWNNPTTWTKKTWVGVAVGLGTVAVAATGVGLIAEAGLAAGVTAGLSQGTVVTIASAAPIVADVAGVGAFAIDAPLCAGGDRYACAAAVAGGTGVGFGVGARFAGRLAGFLDYQALILGGGGLAADLAGQDEMWHESGCEPE